MWSRRKFIQTTAALTAAAIASNVGAAGSRPVILDTDIGDDIDDTWALFMLLRMPELDLQLAVGDYQLKDYPCVVHEDGVQAIIENARFVGMFGSVYKGYAGEPDVAAEWNVKIDPQSLQRVFAAKWDCTITPLDTCGLVVLDGANYRQLHDSDDPWMMALMENYRVWLPKRISWRCASCHCGSLMTVIRLSMRRTVAR